MRQFQPSPGRSATRRGILAGVLAAIAAPAQAQPGPPWWEDMRRREAYERWRAAEMRRRERDARRRHRAWRRNQWQEEREREAWARRQPWFGR